MLTSQRVNVYDAGMPDHGKLLARALATLRERADMDQGEVAEKIGVTRQTVSRWENAKTGIEIDNLFALLDLYGATLADLGHATARSAPGGDDAPRRSRYHYITEETGRVAQLRLDELEAKVRRLQLDVDDLKDSRV